MKKFPVILLSVVSLALAGYAEAAKPKKRTRNANRIGPYGAILVGQARFAGDQSANQQAVFDFLNSQDEPTQNVRASSKTNDIGYQATFGYRFNRYFATELSLAQYGELSSTAKGDIDLGTGFLPAKVKYAFTVGGPVMSAIGILPLGKKGELFARVGYLFASTERSLSTSVDGQSGGSNSAKGDSQNLVLGLGFSWHVNQMYSIRAEYQKIDDVGEASRTGQEDMSVVGLGLMIRF